MVEVQNHPKEIRIFEDRVLIAVHPVLEGKNQRRVEPSHRKIVPPRPAELPMASPAGRQTDVGRRPLAFYDAVARRLAAGEEVHR